MTSQPDPEPRLATEIEVGSLLRQVSTAGGFATVLARGAADSGALLVVLTDRGQPARAFERMPSLTGGRVWMEARAASAEEPGAFAEWLERRREQDSDLWIIELDIPHGERFIGSIVPRG